MITRDQAWLLLEKNMSSLNLRRHCLAVEAAMRVLARHFSRDQEKWGIIGLLHDGDYEKTKDQPEQHTLQMVAWLKEMGEEDPEMILALLSHNFSHTNQNPPQNKLEWSLFCCDELTGLIVAVALVKPDKKLASVTVESVLKRWKEKSFAAGVKREQVGQCEEKLGIPLPQFIEIVLQGMQGISDQLGL